MKRYSIIAALLFLLAILGEISPIFTIGFWRLAYAQEFVMFAGTDSPYAQITESKLFLRVLGSANPEQSFVQLYRLGNNQGKAFALFGLHELGSPKLEKLLQDFVQESGSVRQVFTMCLHNDVSPRMVVEEIHGWKELVNKSLRREIVRENQMNDAEANKVHDHQSIDP